ncbi:MAG: hypothetical protein Q4G07_08680, partial [Oscillospiraceae bacterium]|nr:hypothetical protein [Oscillospiraceae bacterium]
PVLGVTPNRKEMPPALENAGLPVYQLEEMDGLVELFSVLDPTAKPVQLVHMAQDVLEELKRLWEKKEKPKKTRQQKDDLEYYEEIISLLKNDKKTDKVYRKR